MSNAVKRDNTPEGVFQTQQALQIVLHKRFATVCQRDTPKTPTMQKKEMKKTRPKEDYDPRNIILNLRVNKEEAEWIEQKFQNSGMKSKSDFIRMMIFQGQIIKVSDDFVRDFRRKYSSISNNINHIALRLNASGNIYAEDMDEIKNGVSKIWQQLNYFRSVLLKVKPLPISPAQQRPKTED